MDIKRCKTLEAYITTSKESDTGNVVKQHHHNKATRVWLLDLPLPLLYEILLRVHPETIFSVRCVCRTLLKILADPQFAEDLLLATSNSNGLVIHDRENISDILLVYSCKLRKLDETSLQLNCDSRPCQTFSIPRTTTQLWNFIVNVIGSCNGLICLQCITKDLNMFYYVCNPVTGEFLHLPKVDNNKRICQLSTFGFCPKTKAYKVIRFLTPSRCKVHTLGTKRWRRIRNAPYPITAVSFYYSPKGILHWICDKYTASKMICSLDLETEQVTVIPTPFHLDRPRLSYVHPGTLGGLFCLSYVLDRTYYEIFVMKEYGVKESWTKDFSIDLRLISGLQDRGIFCAHKLMDNGDLFFQSKISSIVCYNIHKETITDFLARNVTFVGIEPFVPSFISLKDFAAASGGNLEFVQRKMGYNLCSEKGFHFIG